MTFCLFLAKYSPSSSGGSVKVPLAALVVLATGTSGVPHSDQPSHEVDGCTPTVTMAFAIGAPLASSVSVPLTPLVGPRSRKGSGAGRHSATTTGTRGQPESVATIPTTQWSSSTAKRSGIHSAERALEWKTAP
jgi:hypothetical protein